MKTLIIIPTFNEKNSVVYLTEEILKLPYTLHLLFIDDNSTDGTKETLKHLKDTNSNIFIIERPSKMGLASAYIKGFLFAIENKYDYILQMDGDLSHDPKYIPNFLDNIDKADIIIGSRYVKNGKISNWSLIRKTISKIGNLYTKTLLNIKIQDCTGGYNMWKLNVLKNFDFNKIKANGYSFQIEMKYKAIQKGFSFYEIPITFVERSYGHSKMHLAIIIEAIWRVWQFLFTISSEK